MTRLAEMAIVVIAVIIFLLTLLAPAGLSYGNYNPFVPQKKTYSKGFKHRFVDQFARPNATSGEVNHHADFGLAHDAHKHGGITLRMVLSSTVSGKTISESTKNILTSYVMNCTHIIKDRLPTCAPQLRLNNKSH